MQDLNAKVVINGCIQDKFDEYTYKKCVICDDIFYKRNRDTWEKWDKRKFCSSKCRYKAISMSEFKSISYLKYGKDNPTWKPKHKIICKQCGIEFEVSDWQMSRNVKFCSKNCYHTSTKGENNALYKGDKSKSRLDTRVRSSQENKNWKKAIFKRDGRICRDCKTTKLLLIHHVKPYKQILKDNGLENAPYEEIIKCQELWDIKNGIVLCRECHHKYHARFNL